jgi:hypothetical protein
VKGFQDSQNEVELLRLCLFHIQGTRECMRYEHDFRLLDLLGVYSDFYSHVRGKCARRVFRVCVRSYLTCPRKHVLTPLVILTTSHVPV